MINNLINDNKYNYSEIEGKVYISRGSVSYAGDTVVKMEDVSRTMVYVSKLQGWFMRNNDNDYIWRLGGTKFSPHFSIKELIDREGKWVVFEMEFENGDKGQYHFKGNIVRKEILSLNQMI